jgi:hypothetical protein
MYPERPKRETRLESVCQKRRSLSFYDGFLNQENRDSVADRVYAMAVAALQDVPLLVVGQRSLTGGASQNVDEIAIQHNAVILYPSAAANSSHTAA